MQNPPILRDGLENADLFPMSGPASWYFLVPKRFCKEVSAHFKKNRKKRTAFIHKQVLFMFNIDMCADEGPLRCCVSGVVFLVVAG